MDVPLIALEALFSFAVVGWGLWELWTLRRDRRERPAAPPPVDGAERTTVRRDAAS